MLHRHTCALCAPTKWTSGGCLAGQALASRVMLCPCMRIWCLKAYIALCLLVLQPKQPAPGQLACFSALSRQAHSLNSSTPSTHSVSRMSMMQPMQLLQLLLLLLLLPAAAYGSTQTLNVPDTAHSHPNGLVWCSPCSCCSPWCRARTKSSRRQPETLPLSSKRAWKASTRMGWGLGSPGVPPGGLELPPEKAPDAPVAPGPPAAELHLRLMRPLPGAPWNGRCWATVDSLGDPQFRI